jgi:hypothetical protein
MGKRFATPGALLALLAALLGASSTAAVSTEPPIDYQTALDESRAIALVIESPKAIALIRRLGGSIDWTANADISWRRSMQIRDYCPHQVYVFAEQIVVTGAGQSWRWIANAKTRQMQGPVPITPSINPATGNVTVSQAIDSRTCIDRTRPTPF